MTAHDSLATAIDATGHRNLLQLIHLRWTAVVGQIATIVFVQWGIGLDLPLWGLGAVLATLIVFNVLSLLRWREPVPVSESELFLALLVDVASLTLELYLSGGTSNPFVFLYLLQVTIGAVLLETRSAWRLVLVTLVCLAGLATRAMPLGLPLALEAGLGSLYVQGLLICFALNAALVVVFIGRISRNLSDRDKHLADMRQRAAEEEHIVRMGLLASGAAHELGTPLATLSVILGDWQHMPQVSDDQDLSLDLEEMQLQLQRCKSIVTGILLSAGEARGESSTQTTLQHFLDTLVAEWQRTRPVRTLAYQCHLKADLAVVSDSALKQMLCNVLDNALEASPDWLSFEVRIDQEDLIFEVQDAGPGFAPGLLEQLGKPYQSTKGRAGGGLGLFLVMNVARTLGGNVLAQNLAGGGAQVRIRLPLAAIRLSERALPALATAVGADASPAAATGAPS